MAKFNNKVSKDYKSNLEKYCAEQLKLEKLPFEYEAVKFELHPSFRYEGMSYEKVTRSKKKVFDLQNPGIRAITYTPDFVGDGWIIETKGMETSTFKIKWKMFKKHLIENNLHYQLYKPTNQKEVLETIKLIKDGFTERARTGAKDNKKPLKQRTRRNGQKLLPRSRRGD